MKKETRQAYNLLTTIATPSMSYPSLCHFCQYAEWWGSCEDAELACTHPLMEQELWEPGEVWAGSDCWAFRPKVTPDEAADIVGIWLRGEFYGG